MSDLCKHMGAPFDCEVWLFSKLKPLTCQAAKENWNTGVVEYWSDAFKTQYSNPPIIQHSIFAALTRLGSLLGSALARKDIILGTDRRRIRPCRKHSWVFLPCSF